MRLVSRPYLLILFWLFNGVSLAAYPLLDGFDFSSGEWAMIGVPLHNYRMLPIIEETGSFISKDTGLMDELQNAWSNLDMTFDDKCDYHYALKFYHNGELVRTLRANLYCGYISYDGLSYELDVAEFEAFARDAKSVSWSRISFGDLGLLKDAIGTLKKAKGVYWYEDVLPYTYPGFCMLNVNGLPWNADLDSLHQEVQQFVESESRSSDFYLKEYFHIIRGDHIFVRYVINCEERLARHLTGYLDIP
ncbi:MAG: hypothetical protein AAFV07_04780, partial [Bacteroidota bacterium]